MSGIQSVGSPSLALAPGDASAVGGQASAVASLLPEPAALTMLGDPGAMVAALAVKAGEEEKETSRQVEQAESTIQYGEEQAQVAEMHHKASDLRMQAWVTGGIGAGAAVLSGVGARFDVKSTAARSFDAGSKLVTAGLGFTNDEFAATNEDADATATMHEHNASDAGRAASEAYDSGRDGQKLLDAAVDFYREYSSTQEQAKAAALHHG